MLESVFTKLLSLKKLKKKKKIVPKHGCMGSDTKFDNLKFSIWNLC